MRYCLPFLLFPYAVFAQHDTIMAKPYVLPEVAVDGQRATEFSVGQRLQLADSATLANRASYSLAEQLSVGNAIYLKTYGANGLATLSLQGSADVHSAVVWNGFNLQSILSGTVDLSQLPTFFTDELAIQTGSASNMWGSGAIGGSVLLTNKPQFRTGLSLKTNMEVGSYGMARQQLKISYGTHKWVGVVRGFYAQAQNNYPISTDFIDSPTLTHATTQHKGLLAESYYRWGNNRIAVRAWLQDTYRENPIALDNGTLYHRFWRSNTEYYKQGKKAVWCTRVAWLREELQFYYPFLQENSFHLANALMGESEVNWSLSPKHRVDLGLNATHQQADVSRDAYGAAASLRDKNPNQYEIAHPGRQILALFGLYKYASGNGRMHAQLSIRKEFVAQTMVPFLPALGLEYKLSNSLSVKGNVSRFFRLPTFNDLYWRPGGNPDLLPENGWNGEFSARLSRSWATLSAYYELAVFERLIYNWIRWVPGTSYWSAKNVAEVATQGVEHRVGLTFQRGKHIWKALANTSYILSSNQKTVLENDRSIGLQLIFIPIYQANGNFSYRYKGFYAEYNHSYTGYVYIANDHSNWLMPFHVGNVVLSHTLPFRKCKASLVGRINNIWDARYKTVAAYPMPPRHFQIGLQFEFLPSKTQPK